MNNIDYKEFKEGDLVTLPSWLGGGEVEILGKAADSYSAHYYKVGRRGYEEFFAVVWRGHLTPKKPVEPVIGTVVLGWDDLTGALTAAQNTGHSWYTPASARPYTWKELNNYLSDIKILNSDGEVIS